MFLRPRSLVILAGCVAAGIALYGGYRWFESRRSPRADDPGQTIGNGLPAQPQIEPPAPTISPRIIRTNQSVYTIGNGWTIREDAFREQRLRRPA